MRGGAGSAIAIAAAAAAAAATAIAPHAVVAAVITNTSDCSCFKIFLVIVFTAISVSAWVLFYADQNSSDSQVEYMLAVVFAMFPALCYLTMVLWVGRSLVLAMHRCGVLCFNMLQDAGALLHSCTASCCVHSAAKTLDEVRARAHIRHPTHPPSVSPFHTFARRCWLLTPATRRPQEERRMAPPRGGRGSTSYGAVATGQSMHI